jgi:hypothetical protein
MALNIYVDWSADELVKERKRLSQQAHKIVTSISAGDTSVSKQQMQGIRQTIHDINVALFILAPETYPLDETSVQTDRTQAIFGTRQTRFWS